MAGIGILAEDRSSATFAERTGDPGRGAGRDLVCTLRLRRVHAGIDIWQSLGAENSCYLHPMREREAVPTTAVLRADEYYEVR